MTDAVALAEIQEVAERVRLAVVALSADPTRMSSDIKNLRSDIYSVAVRAEGIVRDSSSDNGLQTLRARLARLKDIVDAARSSTDELQTRIQTAELVLRELDRI